MNETKNKIPMIQHMAQQLRLFRRLVVDTPHYQWIIFLSVISGGLSFLGIPLLIPILEYMQTGTTAQASGFAVNMLERMSTTFGLEFNFYGLLALATALILAGEMLVITSTLIADFASYRLIRDYSKNIFQAYLKVDWPWLVSTNSGEINYVVLQEAQFCANAHLCAQRLIISFVQCLVYLYIAILMSAKSVLIAVMVYGVLMVFNLKNARRVGDLANCVQDIFKKRISNILVGLQQNRKFLKTSLLNQAVVGRITSDIEKIYRTHKSLGLRFELQRSWNFTAMFLFLIALILMNKQLGLGYSSLLVLVLVFHRLSPQFNQLSGNFTHLQQYLPMYLSLNNRLKEMEVHEERIGSQAFDPKADIRFEKVEFAYQEGVPILRGLDLIIASRRSTAIVGGSGAGKTTVLDLVLGLLKPTRGTIYYGRIPHDELDHNSLRSQVAYITQDPTLLDATLFENLILGMPDATTETVLAACRKVHLDDFIGQLPQGLKTMVGENGIKLSGGQKQRVVLARSLLMNPSILILDEATSELDSETEKKIQQTIKELSQELTVIIVAHRLSTVKDVDQVYVLEKGSIVESGSYQDLLEQKGRLYQLDLLQR